MTKTDAALSPFRVLGGNVFRHKCNPRGPPDEFIFLRLRIRRDQCEHGCAIRRSDGDPALSGLKAYIKSHAESQLVHVEAKAAVLITNENVDRMNTQVRVLLV